MKTHIGFLDLVKRKNQNQIMGQQIFIIVCFQQQKYIDLFNAGKVQGLIATDSKIGEGADLPAIDCLIFANFVASMVSVMQCLGRGLRLFPGKKDCLVLDYTFTSCPMLKRHSLMRLGYYKQITKDIRII